MWQYKTEIIQHMIKSFDSTKKTIDKLLDDMAKDGWELVNFSPFGSAAVTIFVFKKEVK